MRFVLAALVAMTCFAAQAGNLEFSPPESRDWSAVAFDDEGSMGKASGETSEKNARSTAYTRCTGKCDFVIPYRSGVCVAVAAYGSKPFGFVNDYSRYGTNDAENEVLKRCSNRGIRGCKIIFSDCGR